MLVPLPVVAGTVVEAELEGLEVVPVVDPLEVEPLEIEPLDAVPEVPVDPLPVVVETPVPWPGTPVAVEPAVVPAVPVALLPEVAGVVVVPAGVPCPVAPAPALVVLDEPELLDVGGGAWAPR